MVVKAYGAYAADKPLAPIDIAYCGVTPFDTAEGYNPYTNEELVGSSRSKKILAPPTLNGGLQS